MSGISLGAFDLLKLAVPSSFSATQPPNPDLWTPAALGSTRNRIWLDTYDSQNFSLNGGAIAQINDLSGNGKHVVAAAGREPAYSATGLNGKPTMNFSGRKYLKSPVLGIGSGVTSLGVFFVARNSGAWEDYGRLLGVAYGSANDYDNAGSAVLALRAVNTDALTSDRNLQFSPDYVINFAVPFFGYGYFDGANSSFKIALNGLTAVTSASPAMDFNPNIYALLGISPGAIAGSGDAWNDLISEVFVFSNLDSTDLRKAEGYAAWKWGLQGNLPTNHPYKSAAPLI